MQKSLGFLWSQGFFLFGYFIREKHLIKNTWRLEIAATPTPLTPLQEEGGQKLLRSYSTKPASAGSIESAQADLVYVATDFQSVGDLLI
ncbi:MAG: hypothetical protein AB1861_23890 [Cyanobacteriota bacterium]